VGCGMMDVGCGEWDDGSGKLEVGSWKLSQDVCRKQIKSNKRGLRDSKTFV